MTISRRAEAQSEVVRLSSPPSDLLCHSIRFHALFKPSYFRDRFLGTSEVVRPSPPFSRCHANRFGFMLSSNNLSLRKSSDTSFTFGQGPQSPFGLPCYSIRFYALLKHFASQEELRHKLHFWPGSPITLQPYQYTSSIGYHRYHISINIARDPVYVPGHVF